jgi:hypothetical protein
MERRRINPYVEGTGENTKNSLCIMKQFFIILSLLILLIQPVCSQENPKTADEIKKEMSQIRRATNWGDEAEAKKADAKIQELAKQLMMVNKLNKQQASGASVDSASVKDEVDYKMKLWDQMMKSAEQGENGDILLGKPLREEIVEAYKDDESPQIKNPEYLEEQVFLCIDMSLPTIQRTIEQMERFKSIKILLITGGKNGAPVNLDELLDKAANYPLEKLYIINFQNFVTNIPSKVGDFEKLTTLGIFNNRINQLPGELSQLTSMKELYVDINPISSLFPMINSFNKLETLGIAKTDISENEVHQIELLLPNCNILH